MQLLSASNPAKQGSPKTLVDEASAKLQLATKQLSAEIARKQEAAQKIKEKDPEQAVKLLEQARAMVEAAELSNESKSLFIKRIDISQRDLDKYISANGRISSLKEENRVVLDAVERRRRKRLDIDTKLAKMIEEYNQLMDEGRFAEAEVIAKRAHEMDPENPVTTQLIVTNKLIRNKIRSYDIIGREQDGVIGALQTADETMIPMDEDRPTSFPRTGPNWLTTEAVQR